MKITIPKPKHLGVEYAQQFQDKSVVAAYRYRFPYPDAVFTILVGLISDSPRAVLDVGCGTGAIARPVAALVDRVDAVDFSAAMIEAGKRLLGGDAKNLRWIEGAVEQAPLNPPYALITAGQSLHWMDWDVVMPRFRDALTLNGYLAIVAEETLPAPWDARLSEIISRCSTNREFQPYDLIDELERRGLFEKQGETKTEPVSFSESIDDFIEACHSRNGFSRERMDKPSALAFDNEVKNLLMPFVEHGQVHFEYLATITWGKPM